LVVPDPTQTYVHHRHKHTHLTHLDGCDFVVVSGEGLGSPQDSQSGAKHNCTAAAAKRNRMANCKLDNC